MEEKEKMVLCNICEDGRWGAGLCPYCAGTGLVLPSRHEAGEGSWDADSPGWEDWDDE